MVVVCTPALLLQLLHLLPGGGPVLPVLGRALPQAARPCMHSMASQLTHL